MHSIHWPDWMHCKKRSTQTGHCLLAGSPDPVHGQQPCPEGQAASSKRQAASLTSNKLDDIGIYRRKL